MHADFAPLSLPDCTPPLCASSLSVLALRTSFVMTDQLDVVLPHSSGHRSIPEAELWALFLKASDEAVDALKREIDFIETKDLWNDEGFSTAQLADLSKSVGSSRLHGVSLFAVAIVLFRGRKLSWCSQARQRQSAAGAPTAISDDLRNEIEKLIIQIYAKAGIAPPIETHASSDSDEEIEVVEEESGGGVPAVTDTYDLAAAAAAAAQTAAEMEAAASRQLKRKRKEPPQEVPQQQPQQPAPVPARSPLHAIGHSTAAIAPPAHSPPPQPQPPQPRGPPPSSDSFLHPSPRPLHDSLQNEVLHLIFPNRATHGSHLYRNLPGPQPVSITRSQLGPLSANDYW